MKKRSFARSLMISYFWIAAVPLSIVLGFFFVKTTKSFMENARQEAEASAKLISSQIQSLVDNMSFLSIHLVNNIMYNAKSLNYPGNSLIQEEKYYSEIQAECCSYAIQSSLYQVVFFTDRGYYITSNDYNIAYNSRYRLSEEELEKAQWRELVRHNFGRSVLLPTDTQVPLVKETMLTLARAIRDPGKVVGYLCVQVDMDAIEGIFKIGAPQNGQIRLYDTQNQKVIYQTSDFPEADEEEVQTLKKEYLITELTDQNGIEVFFLSPKKEIYKDVMQEVRILIAEGAGLLILTIWVMRYCTRKMTRALKLLTDQIQNTTLENLDVESQSEHEAEYDEIQYLYDGYREMQKRLCRMVRQQVENETLKIRERLNSLQAQINPHFLYNTLNVIGIMGTESHNPDIYDACRRLSSLMRYAIADKNGRNSTIGWEIENITDYLELMKLRFEHRVEYQVFCEEMLKNTEIPRLIFQPFVENVFEHGYDRTHKKLLVQIVCEKRGETICLRIQDNGQGMPEEALKELKQEIKDAMQQESRIQMRKISYGIGVENTLLRMHLFFGERFGFELQNQENGGFCVIMEITEGSGMEHEGLEDLDCGR